MGRSSTLKQLMNNASRILMIDRSRPQLFHLSSTVKGSFCLPKYVQPDIPSSSLFEMFTKTTRRMSRFYKRTISEHVPSSLLIRPHKIRSEETDEALHFFVGMSGLGDEEIKVSVEKNKTVTIVGEGDGVFEAIRGYKKYVCYIDLPDIDSPVKMYTTHGVKANMTFDMATVEIIIPKLKQHDLQKPDHDVENVNDQTTCFNVKINRTYYEDINRDNEDSYDEDEDDDEEFDAVTRFHAYVNDLSGEMSSLIKAVASSRLPQCVMIISSSTLAAIQRCFFSTIINNDGRHGHGFKSNIRRVHNIAVNSISNFIYTNIMNRFGLNEVRVFCIGVTEIKPSSQLETDGCLYYYFQMNGVISHEKVRVSVDHNELEIQGVVYDESKATHSKYACEIYLPEDSYYLNYNMRGIKADFHQDGGELLLAIPKFNAEERMMNQKQHEAGEFSKLKEDAFKFNIKVNAAI